MVSPPHYAKPRFNLYELLIGCPDPILNFSGETFCEKKENQEKLCNVSDKWRAKRAFTAGGFEGEGGGAVSPPEKFLNFNVFICNFYGI